MNAQGLSNPTPLAVRMRPVTLDEVVGQQHLLRPGSPLRRLAEGSEGSGAVSLILWGPPGTGKTTLAQAIATSGGRRFVELSAVTAGVKDVRTVMERALNDRDLYGVSTVLFLDEIHRFTKAQQDALLPGVENGWVTLVAATTENPSFSVISPLLSRSLLLTLEPLTDEDLAVLLRRAVNDPRGLHGAVQLNDEALAALVQLASGDARRALTGLEASAGGALAAAHSEGPLGEEAESGVDVGVLSLGDNADPVGTHASSAAASGADLAAADSTAADSTETDAFEESQLSDEVDSSDTVDRLAKKAREVSGNRGKTHSDTKGSVSATASTTRVPVITAELVAAAIDRALLRYDRNGDEHYDVISAFIKSIRGSDPDAAIHYLARMIEAGEDPRFIARRLMVHAAEDIGMADPQALLIAVAAAEATQMIGLPEARIPLAEATIYLATAPKSNAVISAIDSAIADVRAGGFGRVPLPLRDAHYPGAKKLGHGKGYVYPHGDPRGVVPQQHLPDELVARVYYQPGEHGNERAVRERLDKIRKITRGGR